MVVVRSKHKLQKLLTSLPAREGLGATMRQPALAFEPSSVPLSRCEQPSRAVWAHCSCERWCRCCHPTRTSDRRSQWCAGRRTTVPRALRNVNLLGGLLAVDEVVRALAPAQEEPAAVHQVLLGHD